MRYSNSLQFAQSLQRDLMQLIDFEFRCSGPKLIKTLRMESRVPSKAKTPEAEQMLEADTTEVIIAQFEKLRRKRPHFLLMIDEIDAFARHYRKSAMTTNQPMSNFLDFREFLKTLIARGETKSGMQ